jgi:hypothetical protein
MLFMNKRSCCKNFYLILTVNERSGSKTLMFHLDVSADRINFPVRLYISGVLNFQAD